MMGSFGPFITEPRFLMKVLPLRNGDLELSEGAFVPGKKSSNMSFNLIFVDSILLATSLNGGAKSLHAEIWLVCHGYTITAVGPGPTIGSYSSINTKLSLHGSALSVEIPRRYEF